jgi:hypothetical protein
VVYTEDEGVRRSICDMMLLIFHLVLSSFTFDGVDIAMAQKILDWNLRRYPNGKVLRVSLGFCLIVMFQGCSFYSAVVDLPSVVVNPRKQLISMRKHKGHNHSIVICTISLSGKSQSPTCVCGTFPVRWSVGVIFKLRQL